MKSILKKKGSNHIAYSKVDLASRRKFALFRAIIRLILHSMTAHTKRNFENKMPNIW